MNEQVVIPLRYWAVIPAAGAGRRMGGEIPKQYLMLHGRRVIEWSLAPFLRDPRCIGVMVVIAAEDAYWSQLQLCDASVSADNRHDKIRITHGGAERANSVLAGLAALRVGGIAQAEDWVLVHDAARPCLAISDIDALLNAVGGADTDGALLATPLTDTLKRVGPDLRVESTVPRTGLWRALTPQMFRLEKLHAALLQALHRGLAITDEAAAMEAAGHSPQLVPGRTDNIKVTLPEDLLLAASVLQSRL